MYKLHTHFEHALTFIKLLSLALLFTMQLDEVTEGDVEGGDEEGGGFRCKEEITFDAVTVEDDGRRLFDERKV
jgi:hypothetical protein